VEWGGQITGWVFGIKLGVERFEAAYMNFAFLLDDARCGAVSV